MKILLTKIKKQQHSKHIKLELTTVKYGSYSDTVSTRSTVHQIMLYLFLPYGLAQIGLSPFLRQSVHVGSTVLNFVFKTASISVSKAEQ